MIIAHVTFKAHHVVDFPMEGVTREMIEMAVVNTREKLIADLREDFAKSGREISDVEVTFVEKIA